MICPTCSKPYFFIDPKNTATAKCLNCKHSEKFTPPNYEGYHSDLYTSEKYVRTPSTDPQMQFILETLDPSPHEKILDIGCGVGDYTAALTSKSKHVIGLDRDVKAAKEKYPHIIFQEHDSNLPLSYPDSSIDTIVCINTLEHLEYYKDFLTECHRVLKPGGKIALTTANLQFILHDFFYDKTHLHEWTLEEFGDIMQSYFSPVCLKKSSAMFKYYPWNKILTHILKPDLLFIGTKR